MSRESKRLKVKELIQEGNIKDFGEIVTIMGPTAIAGLFASNTDIIKTRLKRPERFRLQEIYSLSEYFEVTEETMFKIIHQLYLANKSKKKK